MPSNLNELIHLENVFDVLDLYLWLGFRFPLIFCQPSEVIQLRLELEQVIYAGVKKLLSNDNNSQTNKFETKNTARYSKTANSSTEIKLDSSKSTSNKNLNNLLNRMKLSKTINKLNETIEPDLEESEK
jgi:hypothetical protein